MSLLGSVMVGLFIGSVAGVLAGIFGIGGGIVIVPMLVFLLEFTPSKAIGTSLASMLLPVGILAVWRYSKVGDVDLRVATAIAVGILLFAFVGAHVGLSVGGTWVSRGFGLLLVAVGMKFIIG